MKRQKRMVRHRGVTVSQLTPDKPGIFHILGQTQQEDAVSSDPRCKTNTLRPCDKERVGGEQSLTV